MGTLRFFFLRIVRCRLRSEDQVRLREPRVYVILLRVLLAIVRGSLVGFASDIVDRGHARMEKIALKFRIGAAGWKFLRRIDNRDFLAPVRFSGELAFIPRHRADGKTVFGFCAIERGIIFVIGPGVARIVI